jgi:hypothetical protein
MVGPPFVGRTFVFAALAFQPSSRWSQEKVKTAKQNGLPSSFPCAIASQVLPPMRPFLQPCTPRRCAVDPLLPWASFTRFHGLLTVPHPGFATRWHAKRTLVNSIGEYRTPRTRVAGSARTLAPVTSWLRRTPEHSPRGVCSILRWTERPNQPVRWVNANWHANGRRCHRLALEKSARIRAGFAL